MKNQANKPIDILIIWVIVAFLSLTGIFLVHRCFEIYVFEFTPKSLLTTYNYENIPSPYAEYLNEIKDEALKRSISLDNLKTINFKIGKTNKDKFFTAAASCRKSDQTIVIPFKQTTKSSFVHEVGHCLFNYAHFYSPKNRNRIMYWTTQDIDKSENIEWNDFFSSSTEEPSFLYSLLLKLSLIQE